MSSSFAISQADRARLLPIIPCAKLDDDALIDFNNQNELLYTSTLALWNRKHKEFITALSTLDFLVRNIEKFKDKEAYSKCVETGKKICEFLVRLKKTVADLAPPAREPGDVAISLSADALDEVQQKRSKAIEGLEGMTSSLYSAYNVALEEAAKAGGFTESEPSVRSSSSASSSSSFSSSSSSSSQPSSPSVSTQASSSSTTTSSSTQWIVVAPGTQGSSLSASEQSTTSELQFPSSSSSPSTSFLGSLFSPITNLFTTTQTLPSVPSSPTTSPTSSASSSSTSSSSSAEEV